MSVPKQIRIEANADFEFATRWLDDDGVPIILSDAKMQIRSTELSPVVMVEASVTDGRITLNTEPGADGGWAEIVIPVAAMTAFTVDGVAEYDLVVTRASDGRVRRLLEGDAIIDVGVTHG